MSDFNDFYNQQLNEYGVLDSMKSNWTHKRGALGTKLKAKLGSQEAQGELNHRDEVKNLYDAFKLYCGEQKINMGQSLRAEDLVQFLIYRVEFQIEDPVQFIYGQPLDDNMEAVANGLAGALEQMDGQLAPEQEQNIDALLAASQQGNATARYKLWELTRHYKALAQNLRGGDAQALIGKKLDKKRLMDMLDRIAKIRLKRMRNVGTFGGGSSKAAAAAGPAPAQPEMSTDASGNIQWEMPQGQVTTVETYNSTKAWKHEAFDDDGIFAKAGLRNIKVMAQTLYSYAEGNKVQDFAQAEAHLKGLLQPPLKGYQVARMLLEFYSSREMFRSLEAICATVSKDGRDVSNDLRAIIEIQRRGHYDSDNVIRRLQSMFPNNTISKLIIELLMGLSLKYDMGSEGAGPGGAP